MDENVIQAWIDKQQVLISDLQDDCMEGLDRTIDLFNAVQTLEVFLRLTESLSLIQKVQQQLQSKPVSSCGIPDAMPVVDRPITFGLGK